MYLYIVVFAFDYIIIHSLGKFKSGPLNLLTFLASLEVRLLVAALRRNFPCRLLFGDTVMLDHEVHILVSPAGDVYQDGAVVPLLGQLYGIGEGVAAFDGGDDALQAGEAEEGVDGGVVVRQVVFYPAQLLQ